MRRIVSRVLPDGTIRNVQPFHVCLEGLEKAVLCRDDKDYDAFVKIICVAARRKNVIIVIYTVVSNHSHATILARSQEEADAFGEEIKKMASMWVSGRYGERKLLRRTDVKAPCLDTDWYVRNTLAYVPRNALDNGCNVNEYRWFKTELSSLSLLQKTRLIPYFSRTRKTTVRQLARVFGLDREVVQSILHPK